MAVREARERHRRYGGG